MFVSLEGIDGSGKTTQAWLLAEALGGETLLVREPGGTEASERIRDLLKDPAVELDPVTELLLFSAARAQLVAEVIRPALEAGRDVVCDRFVDSTLAYQGIGRGLDPELVTSVNRAAVGDLVPDLTILLSLDPGVAVTRIEGTDRFESEDAGYRDAVLRAYQQLPQKFPDRVHTVDASGTVDEVHQRVMAAVKAIA